MPFNFRKTKTMKLEKGNYGTGADAKSDQGKYEAKVREFLGYCKNFNNLLVRTGNDGEVKNVEDIRKCFNDGFKNYYKDSKKYSLFSHTTKVLKGMEKELKKLAKKGDKENKGSLTIDGMAGDLKKAFDYKPKRSGKADEIGKRSAIDDRAVYGFFTATLPKTLTSLCKKAKEEKVAALEEQNDTIEFIKKSFEDLGEALKQVGNELDAIGENVEEQEKSVEELEEQHEELEEEIDNGDADDDAEKKKDVDVLGEKIKAVNKENEVIIEAVRMLEAEDKKVRERNEKLLKALALLDEGKEVDVNELRKLLDIKEAEVDADVLKAKRKELNTNIIKLMVKIRKLKKRLKTNEREIEELEDKAEELQKDE